MGDEASLSRHPSPGPGKSRADLATSQPLADDHIATLRQTGEVRQTQAGQVLFREGGRECNMFVILSGRVKICDHQAGVERDLLSWGTREFVAVWACSPASARSSPLWSWNPAKC